MEDSRVLSEQNRRQESRSEPSRFSPWTIVAGILTEIGFSLGLILALSGLSYLIAFATP